MLNSFGNLIIEEIREKQEQFLIATVDKLGDLGLDTRCGQISVYSECVVSFGNGANLNYYGGFEYVDQSHVISVGRDMQIYRVENDFGDIDERVKEIIDIARELAIAAE
jgi:hypothetical protein